MEQDAGDDKMKIDNGEEVEEGGGVLISARYMDNLYGTLNSSR